MAVRSSRLTVHDEPVIVSSAANDKEGRQVHLYNGSSNPVFVGDCDVDPSNGYIVPSGARITVSLTRGEFLFATAMTPSPIQVLVSGVR